MGKQFLGKVKGDDGKSLEFNWNGTSLGVRQQGQNDYDYVDLKGDNGLDCDETRLSSLETKVDSLIEGLTNLKDTLKRINGGGQ